MEPTHTMSRRPDAFARIALGSGVLNALADEFETGLNVAMEVGNLHA